MIQQIQLVLSPPNDVRIPQSWSYRLYGWLMSQISSEFGEQMHLQGEHPIAHFLCFSPEKQSLIWTVNLLNDAARQIVFPVLESAKEIPLHELTLPVSEVRTFPAISAEELIRSGRSRSETRAKIAFLSPCAFKQSGRYTIFPQETLLLQSLIAHWNAAFPEYALIDSDALQALQQGLHIVDYNLHTTRYLLKETRIPAFQGNVTIEARLAPPLLELWNALLSFASHGGVGIKTTLGMGGAATDFYKKHPLYKPHCYRETVALHQSLFIVASYKWLSRSLLFLIKAMQLQYIF